MLCEISGLQMWPGRCTTARALKGSPAHVPTEQGLLISVSHTFSKAGHPKGQQACAWSSPYFHVAMSSPVSS